MKKGLLSLIILFSLILVSCGDDDNDSTNKIKQIENDIIGIWIPNPKTSSDLLPLVLYFNKDKTGSMHQIINVTNGVYELNELREMKNIRFEEVNNTSNHLHKLMFENTSDNKREEYLIHYVSTDSLSVHCSARIIKGTTEYRDEIMSLNIRDNGAPDLYKKFYWGTPGLTARTGELWESEMNVTITLKRMY